MKINTALKTILETGLCRIKDLLDQTTVFSLLNAVENARQEWQQSLKEMNYMDSDLSEYIIYKINAAERRYGPARNGQERRSHGLAPNPEYCPTRAMPGMKQAV